MLASPFLLLMLGVSLSCRSERAQKAILLLFTSFD